MTRVFTEHMHSDPAYRSRLRACRLDTVGKVLACIDGRITAWSRTTDTLFVPGPDAAPGFYVKRYTFPTWRQRLRGAFRGTFFGLPRGQAEHDALRAMQALGVPAVRPVACGERRCLHFLTACFLITEEAPDAVNLTTYASEARSGRRTVTPAQRELLIRTLAQHLAQMHSVGCSHGNLFWRNVLVRDGPDATPEFFFLDPQPVRAWRRYASGVAWWVRELAQVTVSAQPFTSRAERLRFFRHYLGVKRLTPALKAQWRQIESLARSWQKHEQRRIRMNDLFETWSRQLQLERRRGQPA